MKAIIKNWIRTFAHLVNFEIRNLLVDKSTWILLAIFASIANICAFFMGGFIIINEASLAAFLKFAPFVIFAFAFLLSFSKNLKDYKHSNFAKTASLPISLRTLTLAKFTANNIIGIIFLTLCSSFIFTIYYLGTPDSLTVISGMIACVLILKLAFAISSFTNNIAKSSFESFAYSIFIVLLLCLTGMGSISVLLANILPTALVQGLSKFSIISAFYNMGQGLISLNDFVLFISLIMFFVVASLVFANKKIYKPRRPAIKIVSLIILTFVINISAYNSTFKLDLTSDKTFSISPELENIVQKLGSQRLKVTFYYSKTNPNKPIQYARFADYISKYMSLLAKKSDGRIIYNELDPETDEQIEIQALRDKIADIPLGSGDSMYAGLSLRINNHVESIPYVAIARKHFFEYDLGSLITNFTRDNKSKKIGIITDLDLGKGEQRPAFLLELLKRYDIDVIPVGYPTFPDYDLVITFATPFTELNSVYGVDQYLVKGGRALVFLDPLFRTAPENDFLIPDRKADATALDHIADLLRYYGVDYDYNSILGDKSRAMSAQIPGIGLTNYPLWVLLSEREMNQEIPIFTNLNNIVIPEGGFFTRKELLPGLKYTELLSSSSQSQTITRALFDSFNDPKEAVSRLRGDKKSRDIAFMLSGNFLSAFPNMPKEVVEWYQGASSLKGMPKVPEHFDISEKSGLLIAVADMDFMSDQFSTYGKKELDGSITRMPISDNQNFLTNLIDYMLSEPELLHLRGKGSSARPLTKIEDLIATELATQDLQENALVRDIELLSAQYKTLKKRGAVIKTKEQLEQLNVKLVEKETDLVLAKRKLKKYKRKLKVIVENYSRRLALFNILFAPIIMLIIGLIFFTKRTLNVKKEYK